MRTNRRRAGITNIRLFRLSALLLAVATLPAASPRAGLADDAFDGVPFAKWAAQGKHTQIRWSVDVGPTALSVHQRILTRVSITVDGRDVERRRGEGALLVLLQLGGPSGALWQTHVSLDLKAMQPGMQSRDAEFTFYAFVLPGAYAVSAAVFEPGHPEYSFQSRTLHVSALKDDPLPKAWEGLPEVEFVSGDSGAPDIWYLPEIHSALNLPVRTRRPLTIEVLVNTTPSERSSGSVAALRRNMSLLVPAARILSNVRLESGSLHVSLMDLLHQRTVPAPGWSAMRAYLTDLNPGVVDVKALGNQKSMSRYFESETRRRLAGADLVIILSGPGFLESQEPVEDSGATEQPRGRLIYIRCRSITNPFAPRPRMRPGQHVSLRQQVNIPMPLDQLEHSVEKFNPRMYDSGSAEQFRRILAAVLQQIASM